MFLGSSDLFLPGPDCGSTCRGHQIYDPSASSTAKDQGQSFSLGFGDGSTVEGDVFTDTVTIAGLTVIIWFFGTQGAFLTFAISGDWPGCWSCNTILHWIRGQPVSS